MYINGKTKSVDSTKESVSISLCPAVVWTPFEAFDVGLRWLNGTLLYRLQESGRLISRFMYAYNSLHRRAKHLGFNISLLLVSQTRGGSFVLLAALRRMRLPIPDTSFDETVTGLSPVSFREVNGRQKALSTSVMERCQTLKVRFQRALEDFKTDDSADKVSY